MTNYLGRNVQYLRKEKKLSQQALAEKIGLTRSNIASYENGKAEPRAIKLAELARYFNVSLGQLIEADLQKMPHDLIQPAIPLTNGDGYESESAATVGRFEEKSGKLKKILEGFRAFYELKLNSVDVEEGGPEVQTLIRDFENLLNVMTNLVESNEEIITYLKSIRH